MNGRPRSPGQLYVPSNGPAPRIGISLIPTAAGAGVTSERAIRTAILSGVALAVCVAGGWFVLREFTAREQAPLDALVSMRMQNTTDELAATARDRRPIEATVRRATAVRSLLDGHRAWGAFLRLLEERTLPGIEYQNLTADVDGTVTLSVQAPSTRAAAEQLVALRATQSVQAVDATGLSTTVDELGVTRGARFDVRIRIDPRMFDAP